MKLVYRTIKYYELFNFPLNQEEVFRYQEWKCFNQRKISEYLNNSLEFNHEKGYYFTRNNKQIVVSRLDNQKYAQQKWQLVIKMVKVLRFFPFVRMIVASGSLALFNTNKDSDLDVFIVTEKNRIWTTRFILVVITKLLGWYRSKGDENNKLCFNHFISIDGITMGVQNLYTARLYSQFIPLYGVKVFSEFKKKNSWIKEYLPNYPWNNLDKLKAININFVPFKFLRFNVLEIIINLFWGNWMENFLKKIQVKKINKNPATKLPGSMIIANNQELAFHPKPQQTKILEAMKKY